MKIAVVGSGISGIGSAFILSQEHEVHLFESESRLGGHANTVKVTENGKDIFIDTGFLVFNEITYPHLTAFFKFLNVEVSNSDMSLSIQIKSKNLEWAGSNVNSVFAQRRNIFKISFYRMLFDIIRFGREAQGNLNLSHKNSWTLEQLLQERKFSKEFATDYLLPMSAAIWSTPEKKMLQFPASTFLTFFLNHQLLQLSNRPIWKTVQNGSINYIDKASSQISRIHLNVPVVSVERKKGKVTVCTPEDKIEFDKVVLATHAPDTQRILQSQTKQEERILSSFQYGSNRAVLHTNPCFMPKNKSCWSSWNVFENAPDHQDQKVSLNYYLNRLQPLETKTDYFLTLNPPNSIADSLQEIHYAHPLFDEKAIQAQRELPAIQGEGGVFFAGAWTRYGFHEDGLLSAVNIAELMGVSPPWRIT